MCLNQLFTYVNKKQCIFILWVVIHCIHCFVAKFLQIWPPWASSRWLICPFWALPFFLSTENVQEHINFPVTSLELSISPKKHFFHFTGEGYLEINIYVRYAHCSWNVFVTWPSLQTREKINVHEQICIYFYMYLFNLFLKLYANSTLRGLESSSSLRNQPLG
jgi:hypothetical protein